MIFEFLAIGVTVIAVAYFVAACVWDLFTH